MLRVQSNFDKHDIPYDVLWLDIEHTDNKKYVLFSRTVSNPYLTILNAVGSLLGMVRNFQTQ